MRQWLNALVILIVVVLMAAFTMSSIVAVVSASVALQHSIDKVDDLTLVESIDKCDRLDVNECLWPSSSVSASLMPASGEAAWPYDLAVAVVSPTENGNTTTHVEP